MKLVEGVSVYVQLVRLGVLLGLIPGLWFMLTFRPSRRVDLSASLVIFGLALALVSLLASTILPLLYGPVIAVTPPPFAMVWRLLLLLVMVLVLWGLLFIHRGWLPTFIKGKYGKEVRQRKREELEDEIVRTKLPQE